MSEQRGLPVFPANFLPRFFFSSAKEKDLLRHAAKGLDPWALISPSLANRIAGLGQPC
jgi:hypothetical protein